MIPPAAAPTSTAAASRRVLLLPVPDRSADVVRRYRLARLSLEPGSRPPRDPAGRPGHGRRTHD